MYLQQTISDAMKHVFKGSVLFDGIFVDHTRSLIKLTLLTILHVVLQIF